MKKVFYENDKTAYYATEDGEIWSLRKSDGRWLKLKLNKTHNGYMQFSLWQSGKTKHVLVHRAVWTAFNGPITQGLEINHRNTIRDDNRLANLEVVSHVENSRHTLTQEHMREASRWRMKPVVDLTTGVIYDSAREAARQTGLHQGAISACCHKKINQTGGRTFEFV